MVAKLHFGKKSLNRCGSEVADLLIDTAHVFKQILYSFKY